MRAAPGRITTRAGRSPIPRTIGCCCVQYSLRERGPGRKFWDGYRRVRTNPSLVEWARAGGQVLRNRLLLHDAVDAEGFETFELNWWPDRLPPAGGQHFVLPIRPAPAATGQK